MFAELICFAVFTPATPVAVAAMRNAAGTTTEKPTRIATGHYVFTTPVPLDFQRIDVVGRAYNAAGNLRHVAVVPSAIANDGGTQFDVFIRDAADALSDDALNVEVTVRKLPL